MHDRITGQQANQFGASAFDIGQGVEQIQHAATLGEQGFARPVVGADRLEHRRVLRQRDMVQLRVTARQIQAVRLRQLAVADRREERQLGTHRPQQIKARTVGERKGFITGHSNAHTGQ
ncbi:hypothetical protein D3C73_1106130 [compost metagenome]